MIRRVPAIGTTTDWWEKSLPTATPAPDRPNKPWKIPWWGWALIGFLAAVIIAIIFAP